MNNHNKKQLFLIPFAGGNYSSLKFLKPHLEQDFNLHFLELPGRGKRIKEKLTTDFEKAVLDYTNQVLEQLNRDVPFSLYGHSMGAILALHVSRILENQNLNPSEIYATGCSFSHDTPRKFTYLLNKNDLKEELRYHGGALKGILENDGLFDFYEPILRSDFELAQKTSVFSEDFKIKTPILSVMGSNEEGVEKIDNWKRYTLGSFESIILPGNHFFIHSNSDKLSDIIKKYNMNSCLG